MGLSYHDVYLTWGDNAEVRLFDTYSVTLSCSRVGGWSLWTTGENPVEVAGEYHDIPLRIRVGDMVILDTFLKEARIIGKLDAAEIPDEEWSHAGTAREWTNVREEKSSPVLGDA